MNSLVLIGLKSLVLIVAFFVCASAAGALPGVIELRTPPEAITDARLSTLLGAEAGAADVIAIGESVHGSAGLLRVQARLIRYLVENQRLRLIVWETATLRSLELARWAASCTQALSPPPIDVLYMPTAADLPLWEWVCAFNRAHPSDPIVFRGMDVWDRPWEHYASIRRLAPRLGIAAPIVDSVERACPGYDAASWQDMDSVFAQVARDGKFMPEAGYQQCRGALTALLDHARRSGIDAMKRQEPDSADAFELALSASTLLGWLGFYNFQWSHDSLGWNERDRAQGMNLMLLMEKHAAARAILAAHTSHVSHNRSPADWWGYGDLKSGVYFFEAMAGKKVFNVALTAYQASGTQGEWSLPIAASSIDKTLHDAGHVFSFFTAGAAFLSAHAKWWMQNGNFPGPFESGVEIVPRDHFDAYFFLDESRLDKALPQRPIWEP
ncbi:MAG: erythromycin esterase family protein [Burkholderiales bacterium]|nr:erythromycin esterase family protein [Burkholderiales bacterium]